MDLLCRVRRPVLVANGVLLGGRLAAVSIIHLIHFLRSGIRRKRAVLRFSALENGRFLDMAFDDNEQFIGLRSHGNGLFV
jgi:hypothetical protein